MSPTVAFRGTRRWGIGRSKYELAMGATAVPTRRISTPSSVESMKGMERRGISTDITRLWLLATLVFSRVVLPGAINYSFNLHASRPVWEVSERSPQASAVAQVLTAAILLFVVECFFSRVRSSLRVGGQLILLVGVSFLWEVRAWAAGTGTLQSLLGTAIAVGVFVCVFSMDFGREAHRLLAGSAAVLATYSIAMMLMAPEHAMYGEQDGLIFESVKAIVPGVQLAGPYGHSNTLGIAMALALPFVVAVRRRGVRVFLRLLLWSTLIASASRSAIFAAIVVGLLVLVLRVVTPSSRSRATKIAVTVSFLGVGLLPFLTNASGAFTARGAIWIGTIRHLKDNWLFGMGPSWYGQLGGTANDFGAQAASAHNLLLGWLADGGVVATSLGSLLIIALARKGISEASGDYGSLAAVGFVLTFGVISALEYCFVVRDVGSDLFFWVGFSMAVVLRANPTGPDYGGCRFVPSGARTRSARPL